MVSRSAVSILSFFQYLFILAAVFLMAPILGGELFTAIYLLRCLVLGASLLLLVKHCFFGSSLSDPGKRYFYKCLLFFCLFFIFSLAQWLGKDLVQTRLLPGTLCSYRTIDLTIQLGFYVLFLLNALDFFTSKRHIGLFTSILWAQLGLLAALGFLQGFGSYKVSEFMYKFIKMPSDLMGFYASFPNPNHTGAYFSIAGSFLVISIIYTFENFKRNELDGRELLRAVAYFLLLPVLILSEIYAQARTGFFLHLIFIFIFTLVAVPKKHRLAAFTAIALLGAAYLFLMKTSPVVFPLEPFFKNIHLALNYRFALAGDMLHIFFNYPIFGVGLGTCKFVSALYQKFDSEQFQWYTVINHHLELLFSSGLVGYLLFLLPITALILHYKKCADLSESYFVRIYGLGSFITILLVGTLGSYVDDFLSVPAVAVLFLALLAILVNGGSGIILNPSEPFVRPKKRFAILFVGILVLAILGAFTTVTYEAQSNMIDARNRDTIKLERSVSLRPDVPEAWVRLGLAYENKAYLEFRSGYDSRVSTMRSIEASRRATQLAPLWSDAWLSLGHAQIVGREYDEGLRSLRRAVELSPYSRDYRVCVLSAHLRVANLTEDAVFRDNVLSKAKNLVDQTRGWAKPIDSGDYGYIGSLNSSEFRLRDQDQVRIGHFLEELKTDRAGS